MSLIYYFPTPTGFMLIDSLPRASPGRSRPPSST